MFFQFDLMFSSQLQAFVEIVDSPEVDTGFFLDCFGHTDTCPCAVKIDVIAVVVVIHLADDFSGNRLVHILGQVHHAFQIAEGQIGFHQGEFRIVVRVHAFVAENTADFIYRFHTADKQSL